MKRIYTCGSNGHDVHPVHFRGKGCGCGLWMLVVLDLSRLPSSRAKRLEENSSFHLSSTLLFLS
jgi:hypothetical protein